MSIKSINPATGEEIYSFEQFTDAELMRKLGKADNAFAGWKNSSYQKRADLLLEAAKYLETNKIDLGREMTLEMGKPIKQAIAEVEKCAWLCKYYAENGERFLQPVEYKTSYSKSGAEMRPLGIIYAIMPWNFPFWQVFRCAVPAMMAGNAVALKHAENVSNCAQLIERVFTESGFPDGVFTTLLIDHTQSAKVIRYEGVQGISLTGSELAGKTVASLAGKQIKRTVMELGGSDPFIVLKDADIAKAASTGVDARMQNNGQSCIAAKRFILEKEIADEFISLFVEKVESLHIGDPIEEDTEIGPLARKDLREKLDGQVKDTVKKGAKIITGGEVPLGRGWYYPPTVMSNIPKDSVAFKEELFGPVASMFVVRNEEEAIQLANATDFGLGASLWTKDVEKAESMAVQIQSGSIYINTMVVSNQALPFGGVKASGYGRELSDVGIHEFVNIQTVVVA